MACKEEKTKTVSAIGTQIYGRTSDAFTKEATDENVHVSSRNKKDDGILDNFINFQKSFRSGCVKQI